jgi:Exopolyphosphatase
MREAGNGKSIINAINESCGININIISGHEEADLICQAGGLEIIGKRYNNFLYIDVGGGSTEVIVYYDGKKVNLNSFRLGTVRLLTRGADEEEVQRFKNWLSDVKEHYAPEAIIASGGNINKIHKMFNKRSKDCVTTTELKELYSSLKDMDYEDRIRLYKLKTYRADVIVPAMRIFLWAAKYASVNEFYVPKVGLADGIVHNIYKRQFVK